MSASDSPMKHFGLNSCLHGSLLYQVCKACFCPSSSHGQLNKLSKMQGLMTLKKAGKFVRCQKAGSRQNALAFKNGSVVTKPPYATSSPMYSGMAGRVLHGASPLQEAEACEAG